MDELTKELNDIARAMVAPGKGILAADESTPTITKRFAKLGIDSTEESRRSYREMFFSAEGIEQYVSGTILYDETIRQSASDGSPFPEYLNKRGILPGIKVDTGAKPLAGSPEEKVTEGLDGLRDRLEEYYDLGARFAKWRAVITPGDGIPTDYCLSVNAHALARYGALCQERGIVPIIEPEVLMDGENSIEQTYEITKRTLHTVFNELFDQGVSFEGMVLKPNMVVSGVKAPRQAGIQEVAEMTLSCLKTVVPASVAGIAFLSGGQSDEDASAHLNAMNQIGGVPWPLTFSYGRALQQSAMKTWAGSSDNLPAGQTVALARAKANSAATYGKYTPDMDKAAS
ncbi:MAG: class I fructose-bisphosphate aldolase [Actinomycetota bacterium]